MMLDATGFDLWADGYDACVRVTDEENAYPFAGYKRVLGRVYELVRASGASRVLDIGFGTGILTKRLYDDGLSMAGIDFSERMIQIAAEKMPGAQLLRHDFTGGIPEAIREERYDAIISTYALHHLPDADKAALLHTLFGMLTPGGVLAIGDVAFETAAQMAQIQASAGIDWDAAEHYLVVEGFRASFGLPFSYEQMSPCAGTLIVRKPRMIFFDYGGTLAKERPYDSLAATRALLRHARANPQQRTIEEIDAFMQEQFFALDAVRLGHQVEIHQHAYQRFVLSYLGVEVDLSEGEMETLMWNAGAPTEQEEGVATLLSCLRKQGIRTGVISNIMYSGEGLKKRLSGLLPNHTFEDVIATSEYVIRKPNPLIFEVALRRAGLPADVVWHCGDRFDCDVEGAASVGITPVWYTQTPDGREQTVRGCITVAHWKQLTAWMGCSTIDN